MAPPSSDASQSGGAFTRYAHTTMTRNGPAPVGPSTIRVTLAHGPATSASAPGNYGHEMRAGTLGRKPRGAGLGALPVLRGLVVLAVLTTALGWLGVPDATAVQSWGGVALVAGLVAAGGCWLWRPVRYRLRPPRATADTLELAGALDVEVRPELLRGVYTSVAAGVWRPGGGRSVGAIGYLAEIDAHTVLEAGSITKACTGIVLAQLVLEGLIDLEDPVGPVLGLPALDDVSFLDLATHWSGLPRLPRRGALRGVLTADPYRAYDERRLLRSVPRPGGRAFRYSNLGFALLGLAIARRAGRPYEELLSGYVLAPLGMAASGLGVGLDCRPHDAFGLPTAAWSWGAMAACGGLRSNVDDLLRLVGAVLDAPDGPIGPAVALATRPHRSARRGGQIGLGWMITPSGVVWHNGGTDGCWAWVGADVGRGVGAAVVSPSRARRRSDLAAVRLFQATTTTAQQSPGGAETLGGRGAPTGDEG